MQKRALLGTCLAAVLLFLALPYPTLAQDDTDRHRKRTFRPPERSEWLDEGLDPNEYDLALRYEVPLEDWKKMDSSRRTHRAAGWACIAVGLLTPVVDFTVMSASDYHFDHHPEQEIYIMTFVGAGITLLTGIILVASTPGPEDFKADWFRRNPSASLDLALSPGGFALHF